MAWELVVQIPGAGGHGLGGLALLHQTQVAAGQGCGHGEVGVHVHARHPVFQPPVGGIGLWHPDAAGAVVVPPLHVDRRRHEARELPVGIHIGREDGHDLGHVALQAGDVVRKGRRDRALFIAEDVALGVGVKNALVNVHRAAGFGLHGLGHEGGKDAVAQRGLTHRALEQKHPIGQVHGIAMGEVDLHLPRARFVNQRFHTEAVHLAKTRELQKKRIEIVHRINRIRLASRLGFAGAPQRWLQRLVRVLVAGHQVKLHLGRNHRPPPLVFIQRQHPAQHAARR